MGWQNARETLLHGGVSGFISNRNSFESPWLRWQHVWKKLHLTVGSASIIYFKQKTFYKPKADMAKSAGTC